MPLTVVTWNLKGSAGPDIRAVAMHLQAVGTDVVVLQEVQRRQAESVAQRLEARSLHWGFKHWPFVTRPEGMAVVGVTRPLTARTYPVSFPLRLWSSRRRIYQVAEGPAEPAGSAGSAGTVTLVNVHLSPGSQAARRAMEVTVVLRAVGDAPGPAALAGDLNDRPGSTVFAALADAGLRDCWAVAHPGSTEPDGASNWPGWRPGATRPPSRRLDAVAVSSEMTVEAVSVPRYGDEGFAMFTMLSDHLPVAATLSVQPLHPA